MDFGRRCRLWIVSPPMECWLSSNDCPYRHWIGLCKGQASGQVSCDRLDFPFCKPRSTQRRAIAANDSAQEDRVEHAERLVRSFARQVQRTDQHQERYVHFSGPAGHGLPPWRVGLEAATDSCGTFTASIWLSRRAHQYANHTFNAAAVNPRPFLKSLL